MQMNARSGPMAVAALLALMAPAQADTDWTGISGGVQLGYGDVTTSGPALGGDGVVYGLRGYYDFDFGQFVVGAGAQWDFSNIDIGGVTDLDSVARLGLRAGFDLDQNWLYATGGYAYAATSNPVVGDSNGWFAGVGYEVFLTESLTVGAEVLYHQFNDFDLGTLEAEATTASLSLNFRF